jgi:putative membrane protein insertion efficiency factor
VRILRRLFVLPIRAYQRVISPLTPPSCRFEPSCSEYGAQAILAHGVFKGILLGSWRILRCQPFSEGGLDPVPPPGRWKRERPRT